jgi:hypothetical protein
MGTVRCLSRLDVGGVARQRQFGAGQRGRQVQQQEQAAALLELLLAMADGCQVKNYRQERKSRKKYRANRGKTGVCSTFSKRQWLPPPAGNYPFSYR